MKLKLRTEKIPSTLCESEWQSGVEEQCQECLKPALLDKYLRNAAETS